MQQFTDAQLAEAEKYLTFTEERMEATGANAVIEQFGKSARSPPCARLVPWLRSISGNWTLIPSC